MVNLLGEDEMIKDVLLFKTSDSSIDIEILKKRDNLFQTIDDEEDLGGDVKFYWLKITLKEDTPSGEYVVYNGNFEIDKTSLRPQQIKKKFVLKKENFLLFSFDALKDAKVYYVRCKLPQYKHPLFTAGMFEYSIFYKKLDDYIVYLLIVGIVLGVLLMASIYNFSLYYYNKDKAFIYYSLMQLGIIVVLFFDPKLLFIFVSLKWYLYDIFIFSTLFVGLFATLFVTSFFDTQIHTPKYHKFFIFYLWFIGLNGLSHLVFDWSFLGELPLFHLFFFIYLLVAFKRYKQGYKPALFFLMGWGFMVFGIALIEYIDDLPLNPLFLTAPLEAIFLSFALSYKVKMISDEKKEQEKIMIQQSKLASMGEMIGNISHQWRQPLTHLGYIFMNIKEAHNYNELTTHYLEKKSKEVTTQLSFMSQTIDDFRDFYAPKKEKELFSLIKATKESLTLSEQSLFQNQIEVELKEIEDTLLNSYKNEYKQVILNLLSNAKEVFLQKEVMNAKIIITLSKNSVLVEDNAGGIEEKHLHKIFEPYFSTKPNSSGIGLYMSKMIIEKNMLGKLSVSNTHKGALFEIEFSEEKL